MELVEEIIDNIGYKIEKEIREGNIILIRIKDIKEIEIIVEGIQKRNKYNKNNSEIEDIYTYEEETVLRPVLRKNCDKYMDCDNHYRCKTVKGCKDIEEKIILTYGDITLREEDYGEGPFKYYKVDKDKKRIVEINKEEFWEI